MAHPVGMGPVIHAPIAPGYSGSPRSGSQTEMDYTFAKDPPQAANPARANNPVPVNDRAFANDPEIARGKIISITDRKLGEGPGEGAEVADIPASPSTGGWEARKVSTPSQ
jgi:hypothetical protein